MEKMLSRLFDFQRFENEPSLAKIIDDVEGRYERRNIVRLSDDDLSFVAAAGEVSPVFRGNEKQGM